MFSTERGGGREGGKEGGREGGREGEREGGRERDLVALYEDAEKAGQGAHTRPSPNVPLRHSHRKDPKVLIHVAFPWHL
jgi:hypothetical protein